MEELGEQIQIHRVIYFGNESTRIMRNVNKKIGHRVRIRPYREKML